MSSVRIVGVPGWDWPWLVYGFTERSGGVSPYPDGALNLGRTAEDDPANVRENMRRVGEAAGFDPDRVARMKQVHGTRVIARASESDVDRSEADSQIADVSGLTLAVLVADCVPVLIVDPRTRSIAAVHAGWRPTVGRIIARAVEAMGERYGSRPADLHVAMGPCASVEAYEVGDEVACEFEREFGVDPRIVDRERWAKAHVDLIAANRRVATDAGVSPEHVVWTRHCTTRQNDRFFSHRAENGRTGRQMGFVGIRARIHAP